MWRDELTAVAALCWQTFEVDQSFNLRFQNKLFSHVAIEGGSLYFCHVTISFYFHPSNSTRVLVMNHFRLCFIVRLVINTCARHTIDVHVNSLLLLSL